MVKNKNISLKGKQLRVFVDNETYTKLKEESKCFGIELQQYAGLKLRGLNIQKSNNVLN